MNLARMRNKTYNNVLRVAKVLQEEKGYSEKESLDISINLFDSMETDNSMGWNVGYTMDRRVADIVDKETYERETLMYGRIW